MKNLAKTDTYKKIANRYTFLFFRVLQNNVRTMNKKFSIRLFMFQVLLMFVFNASSQDIENIGLPFIQNFDRSTYNGGTQNWCIAQDTSNILWFGNTGMILWFDGVEWGNLPIPNSSVIRSILNTANGKLFAGAFQEFGIIKKNGSGLYHYDSWVKLLSEQYRNFSDIVKIHELNDELYFQSSEYIFVFKDNTFRRAYRPENSFHFSFMINNRLYVIDKGIGLKSLIQDELIIVENGDFFADKEIWFLDYKRGNLLAVTQKNGMYLYKNGSWQEWDCMANTFLKEFTFYTGLKISQTEYLLGTVQNGLLICDEDGNVKNIINKRDGLNNNTILSMFLDSEKNLWLGLDQGVSYLKINSPFTQIVNENGFGTGYSSALKNNILYLGTNQGLYSRKLPVNPLTDYQIIKGSEGQVWKLQVFGDILFCCHHNGLFIVEDQMLIKIPNTEGCWKVLPLPGIENTYIVGTYTGFGVLKYENENFEFSKLSGFSESSRVFEFDLNNNIWMSHGYKGVYKIIPDYNNKRIEKIIFFGVAEGLPSQSNNEIFKIQNQIAVATTNGVYTYQNATGKMTPYDIWNKQIPVRETISKVFSDVWGNYYIFSGGRLYKAAFMGDSLISFDANTFLPLKNNFFSAFEDIHFINDDISIISVANGFVFYDRTIGSPNSVTIPINIKQVVCSEKSTFSSVADTLLLTEQPFIIPFNKRNLTIKYSVPFFENPSNILRKFYLNNEEIVQNTETTNRLELNALKDGDYTLEIIFSDITGKYKQNKKTLYFKVLPPWRRMWYAYVLYIFIFLLIAFAIFLFIRKNIARIKRKEQILQKRKMIQHQISLKRKAEKAEQQMIQMRNDVLVRENRIKAEEIANSTMELVEKNKMLLMVKDKLKNIQSENNIDTRNSIIRQLLKNIDRDLKNDEKWKIFEENFDEVHENFLNRFKQKHPNISAKDMKLCAFLRMNLSSKEIAPLLRISVRSVEISRYRLRKKLDIPHDLNLTDYIVHF